MEPRAGGERIRWGHVTRERMFSRAAYLLSYVILDGSIVWAPYSYSSCGALKPHTTTTTAALSMEREPNIRLYVASSRRVNIGQRL